MLFCLIMSKPSVLIAGAGIAGPVCAYWLSRAGIRSTIIERAPELRNTGQQIDVRGSGLTVVKRMGLEEVVRSKTTKEKGLAFVNSRGKRLAVFPVDEKGGMSFTSDIEILRENLVKIFYDASKEDTEYIFGDHVAEIHQENGKKVRVVFEKGGEKEYDFVIGADGMNSKTRQLAFPSEKPLKSLGQYTSFFTIPYKETDGEFACWYNAPGGRCILLRPDSAGCTRAYLSIMSSKPAGYEKLDIPAQKKMMREMFEDAGWEALRVLKGMDAAEDFYMQEIAQVKMDHWSQGRVALIGDAGYCPSPISGMGTSLAIVGAYVLAGEIAKCGDDYKAGLEGYEERMRPYVTKAQSLPPGAPAIANPQSKWGIAVLNNIVRFISWSGLATLFGKMSSPPAEDKSLPLYEF